MFMKHLSLFNKMIWDIIQIMGLHENILILLKSSSMVVYISSVMKLTTFGKSSFSRLGNENGYLFPIKNICIVWLGNENECIISEPCIDSYLLLCSGLIYLDFVHSFSSENNVKQLRLLFYKVFNSSYKLWLLRISIGYPCWSC